MFPSSIRQAKALRLPLNSKKANKDFYKGTGTGNILRRKRIASIDKFGKRLKDEHGKPREWTLMQKNLDERRLPCYVVPPGLADTTLKPYVLTAFTNAAASTTRSTPATERVPAPPPGYSAPALSAASGGQDAAHFKFPPGGMTGQTYTRLQRAIWERRVIEMPAAAAEEVVEERKK